MIQNFFSKYKDILIESVHKLTGSDKRIALAKTAEDLGNGGQSIVNTKVNQLGYQLKKVNKTQPLKKIEETDDIFENLKKVHAEYHDKSNVVRLSIHTKDRVKIGPFSRGGKSRVNTQAADHDFGTEFLTPFGI